jgi:hypothetical protein
MISAASPGPTTVPYYGPTHDLVSLAAIAVWPLSLIVLVLVFRKTIAQLAQLVRLEFETAAP